jgi:hypothetical protein
MIVQAILAALLLLLLWFLLTDSDTPAEEVGEAPAVELPAAHSEPILPENTALPADQPRVDSVPPQTQPAGTP